ncbi:hypothetical protein ACFWV1_32995 [Streptomyces sp. NPDC058700]|uniref:hypothetical protein n=1 Tax=unclassified Streptomyces TaxID=2593676 RepID=UPI003649B66A
MSTPSPDEFDRITQGFHIPAQGYCQGPATRTAGMYDPNPYGPPTPPMTPAAAYGKAKPGLTKRGKAVLSVGATVLAGGALIGYQSHTETVAENQARAKEMEAQAQLLRIEELKEINRANEINRNSRSTQEKTRQASIDSCVNTNRELIGKDFRSPSLGDIVETCQTQYTSPASGLDMQTAGSATTGTQASAGEVNTGLLLGGGALALILVIAAKRGTRPTTA